MHHTDKLMAELKVQPDQIHLPAGGVAVFGRTGTGKSTLFFHSRFVARVLVADTGSMAHKLWAGERAAVVTPTTPNESPIDQVRKAVSEAQAAGQLYLLDSWTTLQELQVVWFKSVKNIRTTLSIPQHGEVVAQLRDLALILAQSQGFTIFNTTAGGMTKTPAGEVVHCPAGAITGYQSLNGTEPNKETILARWGSVWGMFAGWPPKEIPRGLYVPSNDIRPEGHEKYAPLKDPYGVITDTSGKGIMAVPARDDQQVSRCLADELLVAVAAKFPKGRTAAAPASEPRAATPRQRA